MMRFEKAIADETNYCCVLHWKWVYEQNIVQQSSCAQVMIATCSKLNILAIRCAKSQID